jgi:hypothetical protein
MSQWNVCCSQPNFPHHGSRLYAPRKHYVSLTYWFTYNLYIPYTKTLIYALQKKKKTNTLLVSFILYDTRTFYTGKDQRYHCDTFQHQNMQTEITEIFCMSTFMTGVTRKGLHDLYLYIQTTICKMLHAVQ